MTEPRVGVITFPGSLDDRDALRAVELMGGTGLPLWHADRDLPDVDALILPGGFSYGDYLRAGAIAARAPLMDAVRAFADRGGPVVGFCNGFQILCEAGLLPGALVRNRSMRFVCRPVHLRVETGRSALTAGLSPGEVVEVPVKHGEGRFVATDDQLREIDDEGLVVFRYCDADGVTGVEVRVADLYDARRIGAEIATRLGFPYRVRDWMEMNHNLFSALKLEKTVYFVVLLLIVLVAAFNIIATLIMVVMEKRKDIAVLKSMGATRAGIGAIFVFKGLVIGAVGTALGSLAGYAACWALRRYEFIELPPDVFYVSTVPVRIYGEYFALVTLASLVICLLASVYPARQAAGLVPVEVIRYE